MNKLLQEEDGFTLLEIIISVATLALISGFIMQMFIVSAKINTNALNLDKAQSLASRTIEIFKSEKSANEFYENKMFNDGVFNSSENTTEIVQYFDKNWNEIKSAEIVHSDALAFVLTTTVAENDSAYKLYKTFGKNSANDETVKNATKCDIKVKVEKFAPEANSKSTDSVLSEMFTIEANKYFTTK